MLSVNFDNARSMHGITDHFILIKFLYAFLFFFACLNTHWLPYRRYKTNRYHTDYFKIFYTNDVAIKSLKFQRVIFSFLLIVANFNFRVLLSEANDYWNKQNGQQSGSSRVKTNINQKALSQPSPKFGSCNSTVTQSMEDAIAKIVMGNQDLTAKLTVLENTMTTAKFDRSDDHTMCIEKIQLLVTKIRNLEITLNAF